MIELDYYSDRGAKIRVVGVGGGGGNAINSMIEMGLQGVEFFAINTDLQALERNKAPNKIQVGKNLTRGLGAGADPNIGQRAVEEDRDEIARALTGSDMIFITAGMGGGTGTGGAPIVASIAKSIQALVVGIVTKPFHVEGKVRMSNAEKGIEELRKYVDTLIVIPNQKLLSIVEPNTPLTQAFDKANEVLYNATRGISDIITKPGYINRDFADIKTVMREAGDALMGTGVAKGDNRAVEAAQLAISSPLLDGISIAGAQGVLVNVVGGHNMSLIEADEAVSVIKEAAGEEANILLGYAIDDNFEDQLMVTVIATGFNKRGTAKAARVQQPVIIERIPSSIRDIKEMDEPTVIRKGLDINTPQVRSISSDPIDKVDKSGSEKPPFLRKIMD
ncbi:MAG: Cell division protein FtsZ [Ignavibacteriae bacterium]|nr:MAG: Cell division protein FtsZ [Ignavibacteriota bacterium]